MPHRRPVSAFDLANFKPADEMNLLIKHFMDHSRVQIRQRHREIMLEEKGERMCLALLEGTVEVYRLNDEMLIGSIRAPFILGLSQPESVGTLVRVMTFTQVKFLLLPYNDAMMAINKHNLWEAYSHYLSFMMGIYLARDYKLTGVNAGINIKRYLEDMMQEDAEYRSRTNICQYIMEKTSYSRSHVMKHLSYLRKENHIVIQRGILLSVNDLPEED